MSTVGFLAPHLARNLGPWLVQKNSLKDSSAKRLVLVMSPPSRSSRSATFQVTSSAQLQFSMRTITTDRCVPRTVGYKSKSNLPLRETTDVLLPTSISVVLIQSIPSPRWLPTKANELHLPEQEIYYTGALHLPVSRCCWRYPGGTTRR